MVKVGGEVGLGRRREIVVQRAQRIAVMAIGSPTRPIPDVGSDGQERQEGREEDGESECFQGNRLTPADYHAVRRIQRASRRRAFSGLLDLSNSTNKQGP